MPPIAAAGPLMYQFAGMFEPFSAISHYLGALLFLWLAALMLRRAAPYPERRAPLTIYVVLLVWQFIVSGLYHTVAVDTVGREIFWRLDHATIFGLIAGTFTPGLWLLYSGMPRRAALLWVWSVAGAGMAIVLLLGQRVPEGFCLSLDLILGWSGLVFAVDLGRRYGIPFVMPLVLSGVVNSVGAVAQFYGWPTLMPHVIHAHELFHLVLIVGSLLQYCFIWQFAARAPVERQTATEPVLEPIAAAIVDLPAAPH